MATLQTSPTIHTKAKAGLQVIEMVYDDLTDEFVGRWADLESRSVEGNAFLSPHFVIPAVEHLKNAYNQKPLILGVESGDRSKLLAIGLFETARSSRLLPLTHLQSWRCEHTLFDGLLVDQQHGRAALGELFNWLGRQGRRWQGVAFTDRSADGTMHEWLEDAAVHTGATWFEDWSRERAIISVDDVPEDCLQTLYSKNRRRTFRRAEKQLATFGDITFSYAGRGDRAEDDVQAFLELESMGWKGKEGTALLSSPEHENFCREMAARFASEQNLVMYQAKVNGVPVASALNMRSANDLFCFKIGWNPDFASGSPGILNELHFLQSTRRNLADIRIADSCSKVGSYVEDVWPWKRRLTTGVFTTTRTGTLAASAMTQLKRLKRMLKKT